MNLGRHTDKPGSPFGEGIGLPVTTRNGGPAAEPRVHEPTISCPNCRADIKLPESLAAPLLRPRELEFKRKEAKLHEREAAVARQRELVEQDVAARLATERRKLVEEEQRKARLALSTELESRQREVQDLNDLLKSRTTKLAEAQQAHADVVRKQRELEEREREIDLTIEKRVSASMSQIQQKARQEAEDQLKLKVAEKNQLIGSMQRQIEELRRKSEQGSQQLQGEALEAELHQVLVERFDLVLFFCVLLGVFGGVVLFLVVFFF